LIKVDATVEEELAEKYAVRGFPAMKWFRKGVVSDYSGGRTEKTIVEWIKKKTGPPAVLLKTRDEVEAFAEANEVVAVGFMDSGVEQDVFNTVAYEDDASGVPYGLATASLATLLNVKPGPSVIVYKKFDEGKVTYVGDWNTASVSDFVVMHSMPLLVPFTEETAPKIFGGLHKTHFLIFCDLDGNDNGGGGDGGTEENSNEEQGADPAQIEHAMKEASKAYRGDMMFITINSKNTRIIEYFGVDVKDFPTARLVEMGR
jgi:protein disulfide-isomerase A1